jgi:hypothetical protein
MIASGKEEELKAISGKLIEVGKIKSIILIGSQAKNFKASLLKSDYDLFVVLPFISIPFFYKKLKVIEKELKTQLGIDASINPIPLFRLKRSKGNLLFFKMKHEGVTLFGEDYLKSMDVGSINDIEPDEFFTYYFSSVKFLIEGLKRFDSMSDTDYKILAYSIAKSTLYCSEIRQYLAGTYIKDRIEVLKKILESENLTIRESFKPLINFAIKVFHGEPLFPDSVKGFWFLARDYSISTFDLLAEKFHLGTHPELALKRYQKKRFTIVKAFQYVLLSYLKRGETPLQILVKRESIERLLYVISYYLMKSIEQDFVIDQSNINNAMDKLTQLPGIKQNGIPHSHNIETWDFLRKHVLENWEIACGKSII